MRKELTWLCSGCSPCTAVTHLQLLGVNIVPHLTGLLPCTSSIIWYLILDLVHTSYEKRITKWGNIAIQPREQKVCPLIDLADSAFILPGGEGYSGIAQWLYKALFGSRSVRLSALCQNEPFAQFL